ncbi:hypothetical protein CRV24_009483 [Beauveria bassiana]|nr:hypothetical protein CRV24_009483 [Beauveria bassiana]
MPDPFCLQYSAHNQNPPLSSGAQNWRMSRKTDIPAIRFSTRYWSVSRNKLHIARCSPNGIAIPLPRCPPHCFSFRNNQSKFGPLNRSDKTSILLPFGNQQPASRPSFLVRPQNEPRL